MSELLRNIADIFPNSRKKIARATLAGTLMMGAASSVHSQDSGTSSLTPDAGIAEVTPEVSHREVHPLLESVLEIGTFTDAGTSSSTDGFYTVHFSEAFMARRNMALVQFSPEQLDRAVSAMFDYLKYAVTLNRSTISTEDLLTDIRFQNPGTRQGFEHSSDVSVEGTVDQIDHFVVTRDEFYALIDDAENMKEQAAEDVPFILFQLGGTTSGQDAAIFFNGDELILVTRNRQEDSGSGYDEDKKLIIHASTAIAAAVLGDTSSHGAGKGYSMRSDVSFAYDASGCTRYQNDPSTCGNAGITILYN